MDPTTTQFLRYRTHGELDALGRVFDATAPRLLGLALHLCGNAADAEDAVQATFVVAMRKASTFDGNQSVQPWLAGILAGEAKNLQRRERRRQGEPLGEIAAADGVGDPIAVTERAELVARLRTHVEALPEEQRQVVLLQLQHGLQPAEIAEVLGVAAGTVRMRLHRGLAALRAVLPAGLVALSMAVTPTRGLAAVRSAVLRQGAALVSGAGVGSAAVAVVAGGIAMKHLFVVAAVVLLGVLAWFGFAPESRLQPVAAPMPSVGEAAIANVVLPLDESPRTPVAGAGSDHAAAGTGSLRVTVLGERLGVAGPRPVADGIVEIWRGAVDPEDLDATCAWARADANGVAEFCDLVPDTWVVSAVVGGARQAGGWVEVSAAKQATYTLHVLLRSEVRGRVVDAGGVPVAGAEVVASSPLLSPLPRHWRPRIVARSGADGTFHGPVFGGEVTIGARRAGYAASLAHALGDPDEPDVVLVLQSQPAMLVVQVVDPDGHDVIGARVVVARHMQPRRAGNGDGVQPPVANELELRGREYVAEGLQAGEYQCTVETPGHTTGQPCTLVAGDTTTITVPTGGGVTVQGHVRGNDGRPIQRIHVALTRRGGESRTTFSDAQGGFRFDGVLSGEHELAAVRVATNARVQRPLLIGAESIVCDLELTEPASIPGRVLDSNGHNVPDVHVSIEQERGPTMLFVDRRGEFELHGTKPGAAKFLVRRTSDGKELLRHTVERLEAVREVRLVVPEAMLRPAAVHGRLRLRSGGPLHRARVATSGPHQYLGEVESDGTFAVSKVPAGSHTLQLIASGGAPRRIGLDLEPGERRELGDVVLDDGGELRVQYLRPEGSPWRERPPYPDIFDAAGQGCSFDVRVDEGVVVCSGLPVGRYTLRPEKHDSLFIEPRVVDVVTGTSVPVTLPTKVGRWWRFTVSAPGPTTPAGPVRLVVRGADGVVVAQAVVAVVVEHTDARLLLPFGSFTAEIVIAERVTHRTEFTVADRWDDSGHSTLAPIATRR